MPDNEKRIVLEFHNGYWDGKTLDSQSQDGEEQFFFNSTYAMTREGTIGKGFYGFSPESAEIARKEGTKIRNAGDGSMHQYKVTSRDETEDELRVHLSYSVRPPS